MTYWGLEVRLEDRHGREGEIKKNKYKEVWREKKEVEEKGKTQE